MAISAKQILSRISKPVLWKLYQFYLKKPRWYRYRGISIRTLPSVFHPGLLISTKTLLEFLIDNFDLRNKSVLELGAGSGLISAIASQSGAMVTASDINPAAIQAITESSLKNNLTIKTILSDLFDYIPSQTFDLIIINPPYFPEEVTNFENQAFYCGKNFEFFQKLFNQIHNYWNQKTKTIMILNEYCKIKEINEIALQNSVKLNLIFEKKIKGEIQLIYELNPTNLS